VNFFDKTNEWIDAVEGSVIAMVTTLIPWLAPALPAYLTFYHLNQMVQIPMVVAVAMAMTVEFLGLAAISTAFSYMKHNKENRAKMRKVNVAFPMGAYIFYLVVVLSVNVILELPFGDEFHRWAQIVVIALLTLISAPAFVIVIARQQQKEMEAEKSERLATVKREKAKVKKEPKYVCGICEFKAISQNALNGHMKRHRR